MNNTRINGMKIQRRLFLLFGGVAITGALVLFLNIVNVIRLDNLVKKSISQDTKLQNIYTAENYLQNLEMAEKSYLYWGEEQYQFEFDRYNDLLDSFLRRSILAAGSDQEKSLLNQFQIQKQSYVLNFSAAMKAFDNDNEQELDDLWDKLMDGTEALYEKLDQIIDLNFDIIDNLDWNAFLYLIITLSAGIFALLLFIFLAITVGVMLNHQVDKPIGMLIQAVKDVEEHRFNVASLEMLAQRGDEIGKLSSEFIEMSDAIDERQKKLLNQIEQLDEKIKGIRH